MGALVIRQWEHGDFPEILRLGKLMYEESSYNRLFWCEQMARDFIQRCYTVSMDTGEVYCNVAIIDEKVIGILGVSNSSVYFSNDLIVKDILFYIEKEHRGARIAVELINLAEIWAEKIGAKEIQLGISGEIDMERTACFYRRLGYSDCAIQLRKGL